MVGGAQWRISGMGMGMIATPGLSLLLSPVAGVSLSNVAASSVSVLILFVLLRRDVDWHRFVRLVPLLVAGPFAGAAAVRLLDHAWLEIVLGASVLVAIAAALVSAADGAERPPSALLPGDQAGVNELPEMIWESVS